MVLKRKRSESELTTPSVLFSTQQGSNGRFDFDAMSAMDTARRGFFAPRLSTSSHLPSRTMKRFRDNRPSESEVYQHTLDVLYSAQRRHPEPDSASAPPTHTAHAAAVPIQAPSQSHHHGGHQRSLHSFWNLAGPPTPATSVASSPARSAASPPSPTRLAPPRNVTATHCEDCGAGLGGGGGDGDDDVMMDVDGFGGSEAEDHICGACGKAVCFGCSVSNLGEHRRCLVCAGPKGKKGGASWPVMRWS